MQQVGMFSLNKELFDEPALMATMEVGPFKGVRLSENNGEPMLVFENPTSSEHEVYLNLKSVAEGKTMLEVVEG